MAKLKTTPQRTDVGKFLGSIEDAQKQSDCRVIQELMEKITGEPPVMWGTSIVGFGSYHYRYASGREGDWFLTGFSPRARNLTVYIMAGFEHFDHLLDQLGRFKTGKSCLYIKSLQDIDLKVLEQLIEKAVAHVKRAGSLPT